MINCLAPFDPQCVNTISFQQALGISATDATGYLSNLGVIKWDCFAGFDGIKFYNR